MTIQFKNIEMLLDQTAEDLATRTDINEQPSNGEAATIARYLYPLMVRTDPASKAGKAITSWCWEHDHVLGFDPAVIMAIKTKKGIRRRKRDYDKPLPKVAWVKLLRAILELAQHRQGSQLVENANTVADMLGIDDVDRTIFAFVAMTDGDNDFETLVADIIRTRRIDTPGVIAAMTGLSRSVALDRLCRGDLVRLNLVEGFEESPGSYDLYVPWHMMEAVQQPTGDQSALERALLGVSAKPSLGWSDYNHIRRERDFAMNLLKGALASQERGVNILLYGEPGLGKTELAKVLATQGGFDLYPVGEATSNGNEPDRIDRLSALRGVDRLAKRRGRAVLLFDEMEDILQGSADTGRRRARRAGSKVHFNRMLETNETPTIWTTNNLWSFDPAFLRRMRFVIELKVPPVGVRAKQWRRLAAAETVSVSEAENHSLARNHKLAPSFAHTALKAVRAAGGREEDLDFVVSALRDACHGKKTSRPLAQYGTYDLALVNTDCDLECVAQRLRGKNAPRDVSFCLYGPPGTGKSAFAAHLADIMEMEPLEKRGSDLLSKWVGESEKRIAAAFEEAADEHRVLIIDEAESLFWSRDGASKSWEASMVNEFLVGLERCPVPVVCTTNHLERVDPAALRRFTFKVKLDYLRPDQVQLAFDRFFTTVAPDRLCRNAYLTPGDFAVVKKQARFMDGKVSAEKIADLLEEEAAVKQKGAKIGF